MQLVTLGGIPMIIIEVDHDVDQVLTQMATRLGTTRNYALRKILNLDVKRTQPAVHKKDTDSIPMPHLKSQNIQTELIPFVVGSIYKFGCKATKADVEKDIFE